MHLSTSRQPTSEATLARVDCQTTRNFDAPYFEHERDQWPAN